ncbi:hypothetical protein [Planococcus sp. ISL-109]|uniref:hypothetical protein n=1 Tax=Planococcus sp. ISL-109 TaxID=2819166 RepID=UPI001BEB4202|nr:hypothetical protein [Planococcus sp. ISL-109]MBT2582798.1 hypothetical protein [Planococcus sp. ISL-109]
MMKKRQLILASAFTGALIGAGATSAAADTGKLQESDLELLLAEQHALNVETAIKSIDDHPAAQAAEEALLQNTEQLESYLAGLLYQPEEARELTEFFRQQSEWITAAADGQTGEAPTAEGLGYRSQTAAESYAATLQNLIGHYAEEDFESAYRAHLEGFSAIESLSTAWSDSLTDEFPKHFDGNPESADELRSTWNRLGAEHIALSQLSMAKGFDGDSDFDFVEWAQDENAESFRALFAEYYGEEQSDRFLELWTNDHLLVQGDLSAAAVAGDEDGQTDAAAALSADFPAAFGSFLVELTEHPDAASAQQAIERHETAAVEAFEHYQQEDFEAYYTSYGEGFGAIGEFSEHFTNATAERFPEQFTNAAPEKMPATGLGGMASGNAILGLWIALSTVIIGLGATFTLRQRKPE